MKRHRRFWGMAALSLALVLSASPAALAGGRGHGGFRGGGFRGNVFRGYGARAWRGPAPVYRSYGGHGNYGYRNYGYGGYRNNFLPGLVTGALLGSGLRGIGGSGYGGGYSYGNGYGYAPYYSTGYTYPSYGYGYGYSPYNSGYGYAPYNSGYGYSPYTMGGYGVYPGASYTRAYSGFVFP